MGAAKGNKYNERWTIEAAEQLFENALSLAKAGEITLTDIANKLNTYTNVFDYVCEKHKVFIPKKKELLKQVENNTYKGALNGDYVPSVAIFGLKNNHGWTDKTETDITTNGKEIKQTNIVVQNETTKENINKLMNDND